MTDPADLPAIDYPDPDPNGDELDQVAHDIRTANLADAADWLRTPMAAAQLSDAEVRARDALARAQITGRIPVVPERRIRATIWIDPLDAADICTARLGELAAERVEHLEDIEQIVSEHLTERYQRLVRIDSQPWAERIAQLQGIDPDQA